MLAEIVTAVGATALIGLALRYASHRRKQRTYTQAAPGLDWPATEADRRGYAEQMRIAQMVADAQLLVYRQYRRQPASRRHMARLGVSERRWKRAVLLLRSLHVYESEGLSPVVSEYHAGRKLERYRRTHAARIAHSPAAYVANL